MIIVSQPLLTFSTINQIAGFRTFQGCDRGDPKLGFLPSGDIKDSMQLNRSIPASVPPALLSLV